MPIGQSAKTIKTYTFDLIFGSCFWATSAMALLLASNQLGSVPYFRAPGISDHLSASLLNQQGKSGSNEVRKRQFLFSFIRPQPACSRMLHGQDWITLKFQLQQFSNFSPFDSRIQVYWWRSITGQDWINRIMLYFFWKRLNIDLSTFVCQSVVQISWPAGQWGREGESACTNEEGKEMYDAV